MTPCSMIKLPPHLPTSSFTSTLCQSFMNMVGEGVVARREKVRERKEEVEGLERVERESSERDGRREVVREVARVLTAVGSLTVSFTLVLSSVTISKHGYLELVEEFLYIVVTLASISLIEVSPGSTPRSP
jgi:hypothetical protein